MASEPNQVGSAHDKANAQFMLQQFRAWGWDAEIETFSVLYPTPKHIALQMIAPKRFNAKLREPPIEADRTSGNTSAALPPYNVYGADGDVTGDLVYVNYGMQDDYKELGRRGISVQGKIVIARYGGGWRGLKPKLAHEHGAIGCVIYSDPRDDGYFVGDVYPKGGWRPADGVQRGSVVDWTLYSGDPLTPGVGATHQRQADFDRRCDHHHEDPCVTDLVRRRATATRRYRRTGGSRELAWSVADHVSLGRRPGESALTSGV